jgi:predicted transcriptional regulator
LGQPGCLICGESHKILKRHLAIAHDLTRAADRAIFELNPDDAMPVKERAYAAGCRCPSARSRSSDTLPREGEHASWWCCTSR